MPKQETIDKKQLEVTELAIKLKKIQSLVVADYRGIPVGIDTAMRAELRKNGVEYAVIKNNIMSRALQQAGLSLPDSTLTGPNAFALCYDDAVTGAKILFERQKDKKLTIKAGIVEGNVCDAKAMESVATIPAKPVLLAQLLGLLQSPLRSFAVAIDQVAQKKAE
ncbi:MAG: 50S ribosomal protein L10 [Firmicutes bacterium]|nr:50S ribosomal protein L10 [Bacillota bacterium]MCL1953879.1 50S ribosomal protein L10 [Bacillota bacterium]